MNECSQPPKRERLPCRVCSWRILTPADVAGFGMIVGSVSLTAIDLLHSLGKCFVVRGEDEIPIQVELECRWSWRGLVMRGRIFSFLCLMQNPGGGVMVITNQKKVPSLELVRQCLPLLWNTPLGFLDACCRPDLKSFYVCHAGKPWNRHFAYLSQLGKLNIRSQLWERREDVTAGLLGLSAGFLQSSGAQPKGRLSASCLDAHVASRGDAAWGARRCLSLSVPCIWTPIAALSLALPLPRQGCPEALCPLLLYAGCGAAQRWLCSDLAISAWVRLPRCAFSLLFLLCLSSSGCWVLEVLRSGAFDSGTGWMEQTPLQNRRLSLNSHQVSLNWHTHHQQIPSLKVCWEAVKIGIDFPVRKSD